MQGIALPLQGGEAVDLAVAIAGQVGKYGGAPGFFPQPVDGHDGKQLVYGPDIGQGLEQAEVAVINVGQLFREILQFRRYPRQVRQQRRDTVQNAHADIFRQGSLPQGGLAVVKQFTQLVPVEQGVVIAFLEVLVGYVLLQLEQVFQRIGAVLRRRGRGRRR